MHISNKSSKNLQKQFSGGAQRIVLDKASPFLARHHLNWRWQALQRSEELTEQELIITSPISLSESDFNEIRNDLFETIKRVSNRVRESKPEQIACLNIDFFLIHPSNKNKI